MMTLRLVSRSFLIQTRSRSPTDTHIVSSGRTSDHASPESGSSSDSSSDAETGEPEDSMAEDESQEAEVDEETEMLPDEETNDFLYLPADTYEHRLLLNYLLGPTRLHYLSHTGLAAPATDHWTCYVSQWGELQMSLQTFWNTYRKEGDLPLLIGIVAIDERSVTWNGERVVTVSDEVPGLLRQVVGAWERSRAEQAGDAE